MVAHVLRLRLALFAGALRGRPAVVATRVVAGFALIVLVVAVCAAVARLDAAEMPTTATVTVVVGAVVTAGFLFVPLLTGAEDPLDPRRFGPLGLDPRSVAGAALLASVVGLPGLVLLAMGVAFAVAWSGHGAPWALSVFAASMGILTCLLAARCGMAVGALALRDRRTPQLTGVLAAAGAILVVPVVVFLASLDWRDGLPGPLTDAAAALSVSPLGAAWAIPLREGGDLARSIVVAVLTLLALAALWWWLVARMLTTTVRPVPHPERHGLGWFAVMPGIPSGAIAARSTVYWLADPRYLANIVIVPIAAVLTVLPLLFVGVPPETAALIPAPLMALLLGWLTHNDLAYDGTGIWMHIAAGVRGVSDRVGRLAPVLLVSIPLLVAAITVSMWVHDDWAVLPAVVGVCASLFLSGAGLGSVSSVLAPYPATRPGDGPFEQPQRTGGTASQAAVLLGAVIFSIPALWWAWLTLTRDVSFASTALWGGIAIGGAVLFGGVALGGVIFDRRWSRIMEFAETM